MKYTNEQLQLALKAKNVEELIQIAKDNNISLSEKEANNYFSMYRNNSELNDSELDNVTGGCDDDPPKAVKGFVWFKSPDCGSGASQCRLCGNFHPNDPNDLDGWGTCY